MHLDFCENKGIFNWFKWNNLRMPSAPVLLFSILTNYTLKEHGIYYV